MLPQRHQAEVTPAMESAGLELLCDYDDGWDSPRELVREIFIAMSRVQAGENQ
jgi:hypothetical protein